MRITHEDLEKASQVKLLLEKEYMRHSTYEKLSQVVGTNPVMLMHAFKVLTGMNIHEYLTEVRMGKTAEFLQHTEFTITHIAKRVGLDKSNLIRQFKKRTGMTPNLWRKQQTDKAKKLKFRKGY